MAPTTPVEAWLKAPWIGRAAVCAMVVVLLVAYARAVVRPPVDFGAYYTAAEGLRDGRGPYEVALTWVATGYVTGRVGQQQPTEHPAYVYPPTLALALVPLTALPIQTAAAIWLVVLLACVVGAGWCLTSLCLDRRDARFWLLLAGITIVLVLFKPTRGALSFSKQADPIILFLLSAAALAFVRRRDGWVALCLGLAIALKPFVVVVTLLLLWKGAYRAFVGTGIVAGVLVLAPLLGLGLLQDYVTVTSFYAGPLIGAIPLSQSTYALLLRTLTVQPYTVPLVNAPWLVEPLRLLIGVGLLAGLGVAVSRSRERPPLVQAVEWGLVVTAMLIFGPLTEEQHLSYLPIGLVAVLALTLPAWDTSAGARRIVVATAALVLFFLLPGTQDIAWGFYAYERGPIPPPFSFTTFLFLYALLAVGAVEVATLRWLSRRPA